MQIGLILCLLFFFIVPAFADEQQDLTGAVPEEAEEVLGDNLPTEGLTFQSLQEGLSQLWQKFCQSLFATLRDNIGSAILLLSVVVLCGMADDCFQAVGNGRIANYVPMVGALIITLIATGSFHSLLQLGEKTIEELDVFAKALLPTLAASVAASGGIVSAGAKQVATVFFAELVISLIREFLVPLVCFYVGVVSVDAMLPQGHLKKIGEMLKKGISWVLVAALVLFTGYLTVTGAVAGSADALSIRLTKSAISTVVPVVGSIISEATDSVVAGAGLLKNSIGVFGMLVVLGTCLLPFLELGVQYLLYKITSFFAGMIGSPTLVELINALGSAFGLILGMAGSCALLLLISIVSSVSVVV
ncbi:MAG: stage III sporulation protein AE [Clostridiales bacterium]|nr:stage III sporulation protein AE [Clostridiales bacterium]